MIHFLMFSVFKYGREDVWPSQYSRQSFYQHISNHTVQFYICKRYCSATKVSSIDWIRSLNSVVKANTFLKKCLLMSFCALSTKPQLPKGMYQFHHCLDFSLPIYGIHNNLLRNHIFVGSSLFWFSVKIFLVSHICRKPLIQNTSLFFFSTVCQLSSS